MSDENSFNEPKTPVNSEEKAAGSPIEQGDTEQSSPNSQPDRIATSGADLDQTPDSESPAPSSNKEPIPNQVDALIKEIKLLRADLDHQKSDLHEKFEKNEQLQKDYNALYEDMRDYKEKFLYGLQRPLLNDLILLYDTIEKQICYLADEAKAKFIFIREELLEILRRQDLELIANLHSKVDRYLHKVVKVEPTDDREKDRTISAVVRHGFMRRDKVYRPVEVVAWKCKATDQSVDEKSKSE